MAATPTLIVGQISGRPCCWTLKPQFQLKFDRTSPGRACKVAWKKGDVIGIKFV
jgi:hypothetical protein